MKDTISIIVPCYKVTDFLPKCVESLISQTYSDIEIILVDDGSPDRTGKICDEYAKKDERVKVIHKQNGGLVSARNAGYEAATGDWLMYVDGDDWLDADCCEKMIMAVADKPDVDIVFWKCIQELDDKSIKGKWEWPCQDAEKLYVGEECHELARNTLVYKSGIATAYCKMIRADYARKFGIKHDDRLRQGAEEIAANGNGDCCANHFGFWRMKEIMPIKIFQKREIYDIGNIQLYGVADYDNYLTSLYGDYMLLPPEDKRHIHISEMYWK